LEAAAANDFAFINLHGSPGEDGLIQSMLDRIGCPYQGSGPAGSFLALNKAAAKLVLSRAGLATPDWVLLTEKPLPGWQPPFPCPLFIKSNTGGSSLGMERVPARENLDAALTRLFSAGGEFLVEPAVNGLEVTCGVLGKPGGGEEALPPILIRPTGTDSVFFDYTAKYTKGGAEELCPAPLPKKVRQAAQDAALTAHRALGLFGYSRTDFILCRNESLVVLETNTLPGMTATSLVPQEAAVHGLSFEQLLERLIALGLERKS
jgi:D-alanine-D-alanine ligase